MSLTLHLIILSVIIYVIHCADVISQYGRYILHEEVLLPDAHEEYCHSTFGTHLASIHCEEEELEAYNLIINNGDNQRSFIGLDATNYPNPTWIDGSSFDYEWMNSDCSCSWINGNDPYTEIIKNAGIHKWNDLTGAVPHPGLCNYASLDIITQCIVTQNPSINPTQNPSESPTYNPSVNPTHSPSNIPTENPTKYPTNIPSIYPSSYPTNNPITNIPTITELTDNPSYTTEDKSITTSYTTTENEGGIDELSTTSRENNGRQNDEQSENKYDNLYVVIGIVGAGFILLLFIAIGMFLYYYRRKRKKIIQNNTNADIQNNILEGNGNGNGMEMVTQRIDSTDDVNDMNMNNITANGTDIKEGENQLIHDDDDDDVMNDIDMNMDVNVITNGNNDDDVMDDIDMNMDLYVTTNGDTNDIEYGTKGEFIVSGTDSDDIDNFELTNR